MINFQAPLIRPLALSEGSINSALFAPPSQTLFSQDWLITCFGFIAWSYVSINTLKLRSAFILKKSPKLVIYYIIGYIKFLGPELTCLNSFPVLFIGFFWNCTGTFLSFSPNMFIGFFWNCTCRHALKSGFYFSTKIYIISSNGKDEWLFSPITSLLNFPRSLLIRFSWSCTWQQVLKIG